MVCLCLLFAVGVGGCGCGSSGVVTGTRGRADVAAVRGTMRQMFTDIERGSYTAACETFTLRSRYVMELASEVAFQLNGGESSSGSACSDVYVVAEALEKLRLSVLGHRLERDAERDGLTQLVELTDGKLQALFRGLGSATLSPSVNDLEIVGNTARYRERVLARREGGRWLLEVAARAKVTSVEEKEFATGNCDQLPGRRYLKFCRLKRAFYAGKLFSGDRPRLDREIPSEFTKRSRHTHGGYGTLQRELRRAFSGSILPGGRVIDRPRTR